MLYVSADELTAWHTDVDRAFLLRAHAHVTAARAGVERTGRRTLEASVLRTVPAVAYRRDGITADQFAPPAEIPARVAQMAATYRALPQQPFVRAAWIAHAIAAVHPFIDANGGTGRFLASIELSRAWLPPFVVTELQRNTSYIDAMVQADNATAMQHVVYDVVQQELATLLLAGPATAWTAPSRGRADAWAAHVDSAWRTASALASTTDEGSVSRFVRRGYRVPRDARVLRWSTPPMQFELMVAPVLAGDETWTIASVLASVGDEGALAPLVHREPIATVFVAPPSEDETQVTARFDRWLARRIDHSVRGLTAWM